MRYREILSALTVIGGITMFARDSYAANTYLCTPLEVIEWSDRVAVTCSNSITLNSNTVWYMAIGVTDAEKAKRFVSMATAALVSGRKFYGDVPTVGGGSPAGCLAGNCRIPTAFGVKN